MKTFIIAYQITAESPRRIREIHAQDAERAAELWLDNYAGYLPSLWKMTVREAA